MRYPVGRTALVLWALVAATTACGGSDADLTAQTWVLTEVAGAAAAPNAIATLTFADDGTLSGNTGCNSFSTSYAVDGSSLAITMPAAATLRACEGPLTNQETALFETMESTDAYVISGQRLELLDASGRTLATYSAES
jgi:heat shock protein HslJ